MHQSAMLSKLGHRDAARHQLQSLRDNFPQFAPRFTLAEAELLLNAQKYDDALDVLDVALKDQPDDADLLNSRSLRSEEHTSELQSLMRISYAVFCLKKKKINIAYT